MQATGGRIAFVFGSKSEGETGIFVMDEDGNNQTRLTGVNDIASTWLSDGCKIVFRRGLTGTYAIAVDEGRERLVVRNHHDNPEGEFRSYFSLDDLRILVNQSVITTPARTSGPDKGIFVVHADGSKLASLTATLEGYVWDPSWSPDGSKIAFVSHGGPSGIRVMKADGTGVRWLTDGGRPVWSPDGSKIMFRGPLPPVESRIALTTIIGPDIMVMNADGRMSGM